MKIVLVLLNLKQICGRHHVYFIESDGIYRMDRRQSKKYKYQPTSLLLILTFLNLQLEYSL